MVSSPVFAKLFTNAWYAFIIRLIFWIGNHFDRNMHHVSRSIFFKSMHLVLSFADKTVDILLQGFRNPEGSTIQGTLNFCWCE
jgi:hypothetical protein